MLAPFDICLLANVYKNNDVINTSLTVMKIKAN